MCLVGHDTSCNDGTPFMVRGMGAVLLRNVGGQLGVKPGSHRVDAEVTFHTTDSQSYF